MRVASLLSLLFLILMKPVSGSPTVPSQLETRNALEKPSTKTVQLVELLRGDSKAGPMQQPLQKLAEITLSDLEAVWSEAGMQPYAWEKSPEERATMSSYPFIYAIQSYVAFDYECHYADVRSLGEESSEALKIVHSDAAKRALNVLKLIASHQAALGQGISFRPRVVSWPPVTTIVPGLPDVSK